MAIGDDRLAERYREVMKTLQVEVSAAKTWVSPHALEFAKRYFYRGVEVTPFPISSVVDVARDVALVVATLVGEERKGLVALSGIPGAVRSLWRIVERIPRDPPLDAAGLKARRCLQASEFLRGRATAVDTVVSICGLDSRLAET